MGRYNVGDVVELDELDSDEYAFIQTDYELTDAVEQYATVLRKAGYGADDVTGMVQKIGNAEIDELWVTDSSRPYEIHCRYELVWSNDSLKSFRKSAIRHVSGRKSAVDASEVEDWFALEDFIYDVFSDDRFFSENDAYFIGTSRNINKGIVHVVYDFAEGYDMDAVEEWMPNLFRNSNGLSDKLAKELNDLLDASVFECTEIWYFYYEPDSDTPSGGFALEINLNEKQ